MAHICTTSLACHAEVNFILVSMGDDVTRSRSMCTCIMIVPIASSVRHNIYYNNNEDLVL